MLIIYKSVQPYFIVILIFAVSCQKSEFENSENINEFTSTNEYFIDLYGTSNSMLTFEKLSSINAKLKSNGANYRVAKAELIRIGKVENIKNTIVPKEFGSKRLDTDFVPGDLRRKWSSASGNNITYAIDKTNDIIPIGGYLSSEQSIAAIKNAFNTWNDIKNTDLAGHNNIWINWPNK